MVLYKIFSYQCCRGAPTGSHRRAPSGAQHLPASSWPVQSGCVSPWQPRGNPPAATAADAPSDTAEAAAAAAASEATTAAAAAAAVYEPTEWRHRGPRPHVRAAADPTYDAGHQLPPDGATGYVIASCSLLPSFLDISVMWLVVLPSNKVCEAIKMDAKRVGLLPEVLVI